MQTPRVNWNPPLTKFLVGKDVFQSQPFGLVDVGVSGGIDQYWEVFGDSLRVIGFDGLVNEIERLNIAAASPNRKYYPFLVGDKTYRPPQGVPDTQPFQRTSAVRAAEITKCNYTGTYFDKTGTCVTATEMIELDEFLLRSHPMAVDFIKVDTDGSDYQVLQGSKTLLSAAQVLGVAVECQFHGLVHDESNTFRNIDRLLTSLGFSLFDIEVYRYSRAVLPKTFVYHIPAQTESGQVLWGDVLYLRDIGSKNYEHDWTMTFEPHKILKLACTFEVFGMEDCATELLLKYRADIGAFCDVDKCLDLLTPSRRGRKLSYSNYTALFDRDPAAFYPGR